MSQFVQWLKAEWETLERRRGENYSARRLSIEAGLSPNTLYQLLKRPEVKPSPETCRKLAAFFGVATLWMAVFADMGASLLVTTYQAGDTITVVAHEVIVRGPAAIRERFDALRAQAVQRSADPRHRPGLHAW